MNIFVFGEAAWDDKNSFGNTISNFLCGDVWRDDKFCNFYARKQMPDNRIDASYYNLSAVDIIKGIIRFQIRGCRFQTDQIHSEQQTADDAHEKEQKHIDKLHQSKNEFIYWGHELIWRSRVWLNRYFDSFIAENRPDIFFAFAQSPYILWPLIQYLKKHTKCKVVLLIADDVYGSYKNSAWYRKGYLKREFKKCMMVADKLYGISDEMSELYAKRFGKPVTTLYKGCDLSQEPKQCLNKPLRFVYAGNLLWGRDDTLGMVAQALEKLNKDGIMATLEVYTGTTITPQIQDKLNRGDSARIMGSRPYDEIKRIMHEADVVLHVESFEEEAIETVRYSLSTKIIDCLQSGTQVIGIGPGEVASIRYLRKVDGAMVIDEQERIEQVVVTLINNQEQMLANARKTRSYAMQKHELGNVQKKLRKEFAELLD